MTKEHFVNFRQTPSNERQEPPEIADFREFWKRTKLAGLQQIGAQSGHGWKLFWTVISVILLLTSLYQSRGVINDYFSDRIIQIVKFHDSRRVPFPSVTVCSNIRLHHSKWNPDIGQIICGSKLLKDCYRMTKSQQRTSKASQKDIETKSVESLLQLQLKHRPPERFHLFYRTPSKEIPFLKSCIWKGFECNMSDKNEVIFFNSLLHGPCFTINPGLTLWQEGADYREFELVFNMDMLSRKLIFNDVFATFWVHKPGTSPALYSDNIGRVYPGDKAWVKFVVQNVTRIEGRNCRSLSDLESRKLNDFYTESTPYLYQQGSCMFYMENQMAMKKGCFHFGVPFRDMGDIISNTEFSPTLCTSFACWSNCSDVSDEESDRIHDICLTPCKEVNIRYSMRTTSLILENIVRSSMTLASSETDSIKGLKNLCEQLRNNFLAKMEITPSNNIIEEVREEPKYSVSGFLGILGGNLGLWVGVSIISFAELIELFYMALRLIINRFTISNSVRNLDTTQSK